MVPASVEPRCSASSGFKIRDGSHQSISICSAAAAAAAKAEALDAPTPLGDHSSDLLLSTNCLTSLPALIGLAVDVVVRGEQSLLAGFGIQTVTQQLWVLALLTFVIWAAESLFEYLYDVLWRNLAQTTQHRLRLEAYDHLQQLELAFFEQDGSGRLMTVLNDDINQLERFLDRGANQILQLITTVLVVGIGMAIVAPEVALFSYLPIPSSCWVRCGFNGNWLLATARCVPALVICPRRQQSGRDAHDQELHSRAVGAATASGESLAYLESNGRAIRLSAAFIPLIRFAILFAFVAILLVGGFQALSGRCAVGTYSVLVFITQRLLWPLTTLGRTPGWYQRSMASTSGAGSIDTPITIRSSSSPGQTDGAWGSSL